MFQITFNGKSRTFVAPAIMGILNVTPDSFSDGGLYNSIDTALHHCEEMLQQGADIIDIGGCSTRPNHALASEKEEFERVVPTVQAIRQRFPETLLSIDTFRQPVAKACIEEGADLINDISGGLFDPLMLPYIGEHHIPYVLMHCIGTPETMHHYALDGDIHETVREFFARQCETLEAFGQQQIILDPGIGFGKSLASNYALLRDLDRYRHHDYPILIGISRKSMIPKLLGQDADLENATTVLNTLAATNGAAILRVHQVKNAVEIKKLLFLPAEITTTHD